MLEKFDVLRDISDDVKSIDELHTVDDARKSTTLKRITIMTFKPQGSFSQHKVPITANLGSLGRRA